MLNFQVAFLLSIFTLLSFPEAAYSEAQHQPPGEHLFGDNIWAFVQDSLYTWHGPQSAAGALVWCHGYSGKDSDARIWRTQQYARAFHNAGFDIIRFERDPAMDDHENLMSQHLRDGLIRLRQQGYAKIVVAGQSRGGWNAMEMMNGSPAADVVIVTSPAAFGNHEKAYGEQQQALTNMAEHIHSPHVRMAFFQFANDPFAGDEDFRAKILRNQFAPRIGALLLIDRPNEFKGHGGGNGENFANRYGPCLVHFAMDPLPPTSCD